MPKARSDIRRKRRLAREIEKQASRTDPFFPRQTFSRLVHEVIQDLREDHRYCVRADAMQALQCATEDYLTDAFSDANNICRYADRDTVTASDLRIALGAKSTGRGTAEALPQPAVPSGQACEEAQA